MNKTIEVHSSNLLEKCIDIKESNNKPIIHKASLLIKRKGRKRRRRGGWHRKNKHNFKRRKWSTSFNEENTLYPNSNKSTISEGKNIKSCAKSWNDTYHTIIAWQYQRQAEFWKSHSSDLEEQNKKLKHELQQMKSALNNETNYEQLDESHVPSDDAIISNSMHENDDDSNFGQNHSTNKTIELLEREIQQNFENYVREYKPRFWPNIPLNL